jgi:hypothetical protein
VLSPAWEALTSSDSSCTCKALLKKDLPLEKCQKRM